MKFNCCNQEHNWSPCICGCSCNQWHMNQHTVLLCTKDVNPLCNYKCHKCRTNGIGGTYPFIARIFTLTIFACQVVLNSVLNEHRLPSPRPVWFFVRNFIDYYSIKQLVLYSYNLMLASPSQSCTRFTQ